MFEGFFQADLTHGVKRYLETIDSKDENKINSLINSTLSNVVNMKSFSSTFKKQKMHHKLSFKKRQNSVIHKTLVRNVIFYNISKPFW